MVTLSNCVPAVAWLSVFCVSSAQSRDLVYDRVIPGAANRLRKREMTTVKPVFSSHST